VSLSKVLWLVHGECVARYCGYTFDETPTINLMSFLSGKRVLSHKAHLDDFLIVA